MPWTIAHNTVRLMDIAWLTAAATIPATARAARAPQGPTHQRQKLSIIELNFQLGEAGMMQIRLLAVRFKSDINFLRRTVVA
jgi:hypothetical protein